MATSSDKFRSTPPIIPPLDPSHVSLFEEAGLNVKQLEPLGVEVYNEAFQVEMANRGFSVFKHQSDLSADERVNASKWWGAGDIHSTSVGFRWKDDIPMQN